MRKIGAIAFAATMLAGAVGVQAADSLTLQLK